MKSLILFVGMLMAQIAIGQSCPVGYIWDDCSGPQFGPGGCTPGCVIDPDYNPANPVEPTAPDQVCIREDCYAVSYHWLDRCVIATAKIGELNYQVIGWAGPCLSEQNADCPDIKNQAHRNLVTNALRANRAWDAKE